jgi:hypothetical protein
MIPTDQEDRPTSPAPERHHGSVESEEPLVLLLVLLAILVATVAVAAFLAAALA